MSANASMERYLKFRRDGIPDKVEWPTLPPEGGVPPADEAVEKMLGVFCEMLNKWGEQDDSEYTAKPSQFYHRKILAAYQTYYWVVAVEVYDGDDGGSSVLTGYFPIPFHYADQPEELAYLTQEFDTMITVIVDEGKLVHIPQKEES